VTGGKKEETDHVQGEKGIKLDQTVAVAEEDRHWEQKDVGGVSDKMTRELDELAEKHPEAEGAKEPETGVLVPRVCSSVTDVYHNGIVYKRAWG
jgi:hypothetical protein